MPSKSLGLFPASLSKDPLFCLEFVEIASKIETVGDLKFANINFMQPLLSEEISPETETAMKELVGKYRPVRQRTVRGEITKDKGERKEEKLHIRFLSRSPMQLLSQV